MLRRDGVRIWYDRSDEGGLQAGDEFKREIERQIDSSQIALIMLSEAFFSSDFIQNAELTRIMARVERDEMVIIPVYLEPCQWQDFEYVASRQMVPGGPTPLVDYTDNYAHWTKARDEILQAIRRRIAQINKERLPLPPPEAEAPPPPRAAWRRLWPLWAGLAFALLAGAHPQPVLARQQA